MQTVKTDAVIKVPPEVAVCPICGAEVIIEEIDEWEQEDDGTWSAGETGVRVNCITEPDLDDVTDDVAAVDAMEDFMASHWSMPYVDWLPISVKVWKWLRQNYRFEIDTE